MFTITQELIEEAAKKGLAEVVKATLGSSYTYSDKFKALVNRTLTSLEPEYERAMREAVRSALASPQFQDAVREGIIDTIGDKFGGAFQGIMIATAKQMAADPHVRDTMVKAVVSAVNKNPQG